MHLEKGTQLFFCFLVGIRISNIYISVVYKKGNQPINEGVRWGSADKSYFHLLQGFFKWNSLKSSFYNRGVMKTFSLYTLFNEVLQIISVVQKQKRWYVTP